MQNWNLDADTYGKAGAVQQNLLNTRVTEGEKGKAENQEQSKLANRSDKGAGKI